MFKSTKLNMKVRTLMNIVIICVAILLYPGIAAILDGMFTQSELDVEEKIRKERAMYDYYCR